MLSTGIGVFGSKFVRMFDAEALPGGRTDEGVKQRYGEFIKRGWDYTFLNIGRDILLRHLRER